MTKHDIIVVGASAGGVEALTYLVKRLPPDLNAAILLVLHVPSQSISVLPRILSRINTLPAHHPQDGEKILPKRIYVAPPNYHLLVKPGHIHLVRGPKENSHRPAIDPLFRTAARAYGSRVIGVVLTGVLDDGTAGLLAVKMQGGIAVVQDPDDATYSGMPRSAIENVDNIDHILPLSEIPNSLINLVNIPVQAAVNHSVSKQMQIESDMAELDIAAVNKDQRPGKPSGFACPECGGTLWELEDSNLLRFRCRTGHAYSIESLLAEQSDALEDALWGAMRALKEKSSLTRRVAQRLRDRHHNLSASKLEQDADDCDERAAVIQQVLLDAKHNTEDDIMSDLESP